MRCVLTHVWNVIYQLQCRLAVSCAIPWLQCQSLADQDRLAHLLLLTRCRSSSTSLITDSCKCGLAEFPTVHSRRVSIWTATRPQRVWNKILASLLQQIDDCAFSALTLLVGRQEGHPAWKNWVLGCWYGYLSGARCRLAYGSADATATHCLLLQ